MQKAKLYLDNKVIELNKQYDQFLSNHIELEKSLSKSHSYFEENQKESINCISTSAIKLKKQLNRVKNRQKQ